MKTSAKTQSIVFILLIITSITMVFTVNGQTTQDACSSVQDISMRINSGIYPRAIQGDLSTAQSTYDLGHCAQSGATGAEVIYSFTPDTDRLLMFDLCSTSTGLVDSVLYVRRGGVCPGTDGYLCSDDGCDNGYGLMSVLDCGLYESGETYYLFVDSFDPDTVTGAFTLMLYECDWPSCPGDSGFSQPPQLTTEKWSVLVSDQGSAQNIQAYENLAGLNGSLCTLGWWGLNLECCWSECFKDTGFVISFYEDNNGVPGELSVSQTVLPVRMDTGQQYGDGSLLYYSAELSPCVDISGGWISIQAELNTPAPECVFLWVGSDLGDGRSKYFNGALLWDTDYDLSLCFDNVTAFTPSPVPSSTPVPTATPSHGWLAGFVELERPGVSVPDPSYSIPLTVALCVGSSVAGTYFATTDTDGSFLLQLPAGTYDILVKGDHTLAALTPDITIEAGSTTSPENLGLLNEGDADNDNSVTSVDFFILSATYNLQEGDPGYDRRADFNQDGSVNSTDFFLLRSHYNEDGAACGTGRTGPILYPGTRKQP